MSANVPRTCVISVSSLTASAGFAGTISVLLAVSGILRWLSKRRARRARPVRRPAYFMSVIVHASAIALLVAFGLRERALLRQPEAEPETIPMVFAGVPGAVPAAIEVEPTVVAEPPASEPEATSVAAESEPAVLAPQTPVPVLDRERQADSAPPEEHVPAEVASRPADAREPDPVTAVPPDSVIEPDDPDPPAQQVAPETALPARADVATLPAPSVNPLPPPAPVPPRPAARARPSPTASQTSTAPSVPTAPAPAARQPAADQGSAVSQSYAAAIMAALRRNQFFPEDARRQGVEGRVLMRLRIGRDGSLLDAEIVARTGPEWFADAAVTTARRAAPFPPLPPALAAVAPLEFVVPINYRFTQ